MQSNVRGFEIKFDINGDILIISQETFVDDVILHLEAEDVNVKMPVDIEDLAKIGQALIAVSNMVRTY